LGFAAVQANPTLAHELIEQRFTASEWATQHDTLAAALGDWLAMSLLDNSRLSLAALKVDSYQAELEFLIGAEAVDTLALDRLVTQHTFGGQARPSVLPRYVNGLLKGFIDLVFVHNQRYYLIDYKFNSLGNDASDYTAAALEAAMLEKRYDLQCALYLLALHRLLKSRLGESYDYDTHMGGGLYLFLRGSQAATGGRVFNKPSRELIESMDRLFSTPRRKGAQ
jgi:exodeoxyribonuclease V beta subunit